jgi:uncharacterized protein
VVGPRQCGKTTLAQSMGATYFDLEQPAEQLRLDLEWEAHTAGNDLVILDEAQAWPDVFPRLRSAIDLDRNRKGRFIILGSVSPALMTRVSESLAGRLSLVELTPFLLPEVAPAVPLERIWMHGGYPDGGALAEGMFPHWQSDYITLLTQRDLPAWGLPAKPQVTQRLLRMLAALHAQPWNASQVGQSMGLSYHTVNDYLDYLSGAFLIRTLPAFQANVRKRLVKRPKVYWRDSGLLHAVMNVSDRKALLSQPWVGASWEGFVIEQALGVLASAGCPVSAYYFRTSDQYELDLLLDFGSDRVAVEVKLTSSPAPEDMARLAKTARMIDANRCILVSQTPRSVGDDDRLSCNLPTFLEQLRRYGRLPGE